MNALLLLCALAASPPGGLDAARAHLAQGKLDEVLFDLDGKALPDADKPAAGDLLARAGQRALEKDDALLALQFAQMALKDEPSHALALEVGARASRAEQQYTPAEDYCDRWLMVSQGSARARLLRAELATDQGEWQHGLDLVGGMRESELAGEERQRLALVRSTCRKELATRHANVSEMRSLEQKMEAAAERAKKREAEGRPVIASARAPSEVVLYGTSWCGYCRQAREYLHQKGVDFVDKDVEQDPGAAEELAMKKASAHRAGGGVPWIDVRGTLIQGFDRPELDRLLR